MPIPVRNIPKPLGVLGSLLYGVGLFVGTYAIAEWLDVPKIVGFLIAFLAVPMVLILLACVVAAPFLAAQESAIKRMRQGCACDARAARQVMKEGIDAEFGPLSEVLSDKETPSRMKLAAIRGCAEASRAETERDSSGPARRMEAFLEGVERAHPTLKPEVAMLRDLRGGLLSLALSLDTPRRKPGESSMGFVKRVGAMASEKLLAIEQQMGRYHEAWQSLVKALSTQEHPVS